MSKPRKDSFGGKWTEEKLGALSAYLQAYTTALKNTHFDLTYIDAFAGAGTEEIITSKESDLFSGEVPEDSIQYRHGSPLIALKNKPAFHNFIFIDQHEQSLAKLRNQIETEDLIAPDRVRFFHGDANEHIQTIAAENWRVRRAVAFLDPFALHVTWQTLERVASTESIDMWLLFNAMAVNRMLTKSGEIPEAWANKLTTTFGSDSWRDYFYRPSERDLFGDEVVEKREKIFENLSDYITQRLGTIFPGVHKRPLVLRNSTGAPLFLLCFACGNPNPKAISAALRIAQHIIDKGSKG